jgi:hypothetical protein
MLNFFILSDGVRGSVSDVHGFPFERKYAVKVATDDRQPGHSKGLRRVSLSDDQSALLRACTPSHIRVIQFGNSRQLHLLDTPLSLERFLVFKRRIRENLFGYFTLLNLFEELGAQFEL